MSSPAKRRDADVLKLMMTNHKVCPANDDSVADLFVQFSGPPSSPYEGGTWKVHVVLPVQYPLKSPSIGFCNRIFHPNIDEASGTVCLDVINQTWSPMYDLVNIFDIFLPQLLKYPNSADPLNSSAATLHCTDKDGYLRKVKDYVERFAQPSDAAFGDDDEDDSDNLSDISDEDSDLDLGDVNEHTASLMDF